MRKRVRISTIDVDGERLLLCTRTNTDADVLPNHDAILARTAQGVTRILAA